MHVAWREARPYVLVPLVAGVGLRAARRRRAGWLAIGAAAAAVLFFRDPERELRPDPQLVFAAADGLVTRVEPRVDEPWLPGGALDISTFLSVHNVHVNRSPVAGRIAESQDVSGGFAPALLAGSKANRRRRLAIEGPMGCVVVVQVAGMLARRISTWVRPGDQVAAGQRIGIIHFGSRTDVLLPADRAKVLVHVGQRVLAGVTPLARYHDPAACS